MKLDHQISIQPPKYSDQNGKIIIPPEIITDKLDITYSDNPTRKTYYAFISGFPTPVSLLSESNYSSFPSITSSLGESLLREKMGTDQASFLRKLFPVTLEENPNGPGTILSGMISSLGIKTTANCSCKKHALEMNEKGPDWCEQNIDTILSWLREESNKRGLPYVDTVARMMVNKAIAKSRKLLNKK